MKCEWNKLVKCEFFFQISRNYWMMIRGIWNMGSKLVEYGFHLYTIKINRIRISLVYNSFSNTNNANIPKHS